jgi:hypothetical protein
MGSALLGLVNLWFWLRGRRLARDLMALIDFEWERLDGNASSRWEASKHSVHEITSCCSRTIMFKASPVCLVDFDDL